MWVRSEYAGELSVLATWLCALSPWAVTFGRVQQLDTSVWIFWFHPRRFLFLPGVEFEGTSGVPSWAWEFADQPLYGGDTFWGLVWIGGTLLLLGAFGFSLLYYFREDQIERSALDPVRVLGALLLVSGVVLGAVVVALFRNHPGTTVPLGAALQLVFGVVLLRTERIDPE